MDSSTVINPETGRRIKINGPTYLKLLKRGLIAPTLSQQVMCLGETVQAILIQCPSSELMRYRQINRQYRTLATEILVTRLTEGRIKLRAENDYDTAPLQPVIEHFKTHRQFSVIRILLQVLPINLRQPLATSLLTIYPPCVETQKIVIPYVSLSYLQYIHTTDPEVLMMFLRRGTNPVTILQTASSIKIPEPYWTQIKDIGSYLFPNPTEMKKWTHAQVATELKKMWPHE